MTSALRPLVRNLLIVALLSVPVALIVFIVIQDAAGKNETGSLGAGIASMVVLYPGIVMPSLLGALLYTAVLVVIARPGRKLNRVAAILLTPLVLLPWLLFPVADLLSSAPLLGGILVGLLLLGMLAGVPGGEYAAADRGSNG